MSDITRSHTAIRPSRDPGLAGVLGPRDVLSFVYDVGGRELSVGLVTWMVVGALFGSGFLLIGAGLVGTLTRRRRPAFSGLNAISGRSM